MFGRCPESSHCDPDIERRILAVAQDIIFSATNSCCKTPKHVGLAMSVKHVTSSRIVLKLLNSLEHSTSCDDMHLLDTAIATSVISNLTEGETYLPTNISPGTLYIYNFSTVVDFSSEKYSGSTGHKNSWYQ